MPVSQALKLINDEDVRVAAAVRRQIPRMTKAVQIMRNALSAGRKIVFIGAGTSGRLGVMEAAECPPTFNTRPAMVQAIMAGGRSSVFRSKEGAEDRGAEGARLVRERARAGDVVIGIAASGITPFVREGLRAAAGKRAKTILITCNPSTPARLAGITIALGTGPEIIAGSTRLKAATATKMALNALTVATMVQLGKVYGNRMVDLQPRSHKLQERATRLIQDLAGVSRPRAAALLKASGGNAKTAIVMARKKLPRAAAVRLLRRHDGRLRRALAG